MHWLGGIAMTVVGVVGAVVLVNVVATRLGTRPVGLWGATAPSA